MGGAVTRLVLSRAWVLGLVALLLGPTLFGSGFLLTYDMVWVPDLALRSDFLGLGSGVPRAVPSDAWVAVLDEVVGGMVLQKVVLAGSLLAGGLGIQRWVRGPKGGLAAAAAATVYVWNPYVVERLAIGHWPMLLCYGLLPWIGLLVIRWAHQDRPRPVLLVLLPLASLNASAGLAAAVVVAVFGFTGSERSASPRRLAGWGAAVLLANLPWLVAGAVKADLLGRVNGAAAVFAPAGEGALPLPFGALSLGGIWNLEVVPSSRGSMLAWAASALAVVVLVGARRWLWCPRQRGWFWCGVVGWGLTVFGWAAPGAVGWLADAVPGAAVLRDGSRLLLLLAPLLAIAVGEGVRLLIERAGEAAPVLAVCCLLAPLALLPDAAWGSFGSLRPVHYPSDYEQMRSAVDQVHDGRDVLVLPYTSYRAPDWNDGRKIFDPVGRYQDHNYLSSGDLAVSGRQLGEEDPRGRAVLEALQAPSPEQRAEELAGLGIGVVVIDEPLAASPGQAPYAAELTGSARLEAGDFAVIALPRAQAGPGDGSRVDGVARLFVLAGWMGQLALLLVGTGWSALLALRRVRAARGIRHTDRPKPDS